MAKKTLYSSILISHWLTTDHRVDKRVKFKTLGYKTYFNCQHLLMKLKPLERGVLDFLIEKADDKNLVLVNDLLKEEYRSFLLEVSQLNISKTVAAKAVSKLASIGLILAEPMVRGLYRINPKYFWSGSEKKRMMVLEQTIIERLNTELPVNHLIDIPMEVFLENVNKKNNFG
jgi:hypothetical protein